ncbi:PAS domain S-box protein [Halobacteria archaeon AArc-m2/3/4]|uniref:histidine kinase n=1 Tax=Natronoglomus mannanivorans TaxID=2979990 RepID=A0ABT2QB46_9EURY|nr:PAS domain S-box protein [Halobacteria archaeon AArc-m2/3/4]
MVTPSIRRAGFDRGAAVGSPTTRGMLAVVAIGFVVTIGTIDATSVLPSWTVLFGLVGLSVRDGDGDDDSGDIERVTAEVRRLAAGPDTVAELEQDPDPSRDENARGDIDVALPTDRDDEIGRLAEAVDDLAETVRTRERRTRESERYRKELYRITSSSDLTDEAKLEALLELGCERLGVETGFVARIDDSTGSFEIRTATGDDFVRAGMEAPLSNTICRKTITSDDILGIRDTSEGEWGTDPAPERWSIGCYVGGKIVVDDDLVGTVCFVDREPREEPFSHEDRAFADLVTRWVSHVTERREYTRDLRLVDRAMEAAPIGITITDPDREDNPLVRANRGFERVTGYTPAEAIGRNCRFLQGAATDPERVEELRRAIDTAEPTSVELRNYRRDGTPFWNRVTVAPVEGDGKGKREDCDESEGEDESESESECEAKRTDDNEITHFVGFQEDVTERVERERELERYREYTDDVLDAIDDVFYILGRDGGLERWNESLTEVTGYSDAELESMNVVDFFGEDDRDVIEEAMETVLETGHVRVDLPYLTKEGNSIPYEFVASRLEDVDGDPVVVGIGRDVTERERYERELERTTHRLEQSQRLADVGAWEFDVRNDEVHATDEVLRLHGISSDEGIEIDLQSALEFYHPDDRPRLRAAVERAIADGESYDLELRLLAADGQQRWVRTIGEPVSEDGEVVTLHGSFQDVTDRKERERDLERTTDLLQRVQAMADIGGFELDVRSEPPDSIWTDELYRVHDLPPDTDINFEAVLECYHPDDRRRVRQRLERALETETDYDFEARLLTQAGETRWVRAMGESLHEDGQLVKYRGSIQDITAQKERELALSSLHDATRGLLHAETEPDVAELVVDAADDVLDVSGVGLYLLDTATNALEPAATTPGFGSRTGGDSEDTTSDAPSIAAGDHDSALWNTLVTGNQTVFDSFDSEFETGGRSPDSDDGERRSPGQSSTDTPDDTPGQSGLAVPIGDHGVFVVTAPQSAIDGGMRRLVETLVATATAAFDRLESEASLRERDIELQERNRRLRRQIQINEIIRTIDQSLIDATSQDEIERTVCDRLAATEDVAFAWIGDLDVSETELVPQAWVGTNPEYLDEVSLDAATSSEPAVTTARTDRPTVVANVVEDLQTEHWRRAALAQEFASCLSVPLAVDDYSYGVLTVYATEPETFGDLERTVFAELGESIANAITAVKTRQALHADTHLELTLQFDGPETCLGRLARETSCRVEYEGVTTHSADETRLFFTTSECRPDAVGTFLDDLVSVTDWRLIGESGADDEAESRFEATVSGPTVPSRLLRHGATPRTIRATETGLEAVVDLPTGSDVREFLEMLGDRYPSVELTGRRDVERATETRRELTTSLVEPLTDRQLEVLRTAYYAGFFDWPRESTGEEIADMLGVTQPTVNRHLRLGQRRLLEQLFEADSHATVEA